MKKNLILTTVSVACSLVLIQAIIFVKSGTSVSQAQSSTERASAARLSEHITLRAAGRGAPLLRLGNGHEVIAQYTGAQAAEQALNANTARPIALASADFDADGVADLVSGYAAAAGGIITLHRGNGEMIHPGSRQSRARDTENLQGNSPFLSPATAFDLPLAPDFIVAGDFNRDKHLDLVTAARRSNELYLLPGDGRGGFRSAERIRLAGAVTALASGQMNRPDEMADIVVGIAAADGPKALVLQGPEGALKSEPEQFSLPAEATALALDHLDSDGNVDLAVASGDRLIIIRGRDRKLSSDQLSRQSVRQAEIERRSFASAIKAIAIGNFDEDNLKDLALLATDGTLRILNRPQANRNQRINKWHSDTIAQASWPQAAGLISAHVASLPTDNLVIIDSMNRQLHIVIADKALRASAQGTRVVTTLDAEAEPIAVLPMRLNVDSLSDLVILTSGHVAPAVAVTPSADVTLTVITTADNSDPTPGDGVCGDIGIPCSLRAAIQEANALPGADMIRFAIDAGPGPHTITPATPLPTITSPVTIDGYTNPGASPNTLPDGNDAVLQIEINGTNAGAGTNGLFITASFSTIRGLVINRFGGAAISLMTGGGHTIEGNFLGTNVAGTGALPNSNGISIANSTSNLIGGTSPAARNVISGNTIDGVLISQGNSAETTIQGNFIGVNAFGTEDLGNGQAGVHITGLPSNSGILIGGEGVGARNVISGNNEGIRLFTNDNDVIGNFIGTDVTGNIDLGNTAIGVFIQGANPGEGTSHSISGNVISGNDLAGVRIAGANAIDNIITANLIGTNAAGAAALGNGDGVVISGSSPNLIGGASSAAFLGNVISGNNGVGVRIQGNLAAGNLVLGNRIGTDFTGASDVGNAQGGVVIEQTGSNNKIGGTFANEGNVIAFNDGDGVFVASGTGNAILSNSIFSNLGLGIDLAPAGVTPNDPCDTDNGANNLQNSPVLTSASSMGGVTTINGTLSSTPNMNFRIEFFSNDACDESGFGEGRNFIGSTTVTPPSSSNCGATFNVSFPIAVAPGQVITATATDPNNNTSEFSQCATVGPGGLESGDLSIIKTDSPDPVQPGSNITYTIIVSALSGNATGVTFTDTIPVGTTFVSLTSPGDCQTPPVGGTGTVTCALGTIAGGQPVTITLVVNVTAQPGATITNTARVTSMSTDPNPDNNTASATTTVVNPCAEDNTPPRIDCPASIVLPLPAGAQSLVVSYPPPFVLDNCPGPTVECTPPSNSTFLPGVTRVTCTATDRVGNTSICAFTVTINDQTAPTITCPAPITITTLPGLCGAGTVTFPTPTFSDNLPGGTVVCTPPSGSAFPIGTTPVTCTATDAANNRASCTFSITIISPAQTRLTLEGNGAALSFGPADPPRKRKNNPPSDCSCVRTFTIENISCGPLSLTLESILRTGIDVTENRITDPDDSDLFSVFLINPNGSQTQLSIGSNIILQPGQRSTFRVVFRPAVPAAFSGRTDDLSAEDVLPDPVTSRITFRQNPGNLLVINLVADVDTQVRLVNPNNPRQQKRLIFERDGNEFIVTVGVYDPNLDVSRMRIEFFNSNGQQVSQAFDIDLVQPIRDSGIVRGQSFRIVQRFTGAASNPEVASVRVTVFDSESSDSATASLRNVSGSAASVQSTRSARSATLYLPVRKLELSVP